MPDSRESIAPVAFVSHGAPTLALDVEKGADLARWAGELGSFDAVLVVSAHWERTPIAVGTTRTSELVYDFGGFRNDDELFSIRYPAPGAPKLAARVAKMLGGAVRDEARGWDHGVWVPLVHMFPDADVPVLQVSLPSRATTRELFEVGLELAPLREENVLVLASGGMVHDLSRLDWTDTTDPPEWATAFEGWARAALEQGDVESLLDFRRAAPDAGRAHPTPEHFLPLLVALGAASTTPWKASYPVEGFEYGSLSRLSVQLG